MNKSSSVKAIWRSKNSMSISRYKYVLFKQQDRKNWYVLLL